MSANDSLTKALGSGGVLIPRNRFIRPLLVCDAKTSCAPGDTARINIGASNPGESLRTLQILSLGFNLGESLSFGGVT